MKTARTAARLIAPSFVASVLVLVAVGAQAFQLRGFRGVEWGAEAERLGPDATVVSREGELTCYQRANENLLFGDTELKAVHYCFVNDRLYTVRLEAAVGAKALAAEVERAYGRPDARRGLNATWGRKASDARAELVSRGEHSQLTLSPDSLRKTELALRSTAAPTPGF